MKSVLFFANLLWWALPILASVAIWNRVQSLDFRALAIGAVWLPFLFVTGVLCEYNKKLNEKAKGKL